ncbi:ion channel [Colwellia hornerae]|uniref:Pentapeptide repeat-containing protein n=1 Tax=Colwellia hornerae TaxID=89402 RepID=A0A5C6QRB2_9GAMM|nr:ion channel [Colwellia hornerae]TWX55668.1 pentapeptide repeat-containing protein [Colwellia hornerae]TWX61878.1 pentapeptide repeat-containing protein [Colwellia hornerae]TWX71210.1 pentapeptide repeat-containing protein [Colwellia hornerae]
MKKLIQRCQYRDPLGYICQENANKTGLCYWHDHSLDKSGDEVKQALVDYARSGGLTRGISLKNADLSDIDLVNHHHKVGFDFSYADFYHANLLGAHLFNINFNKASLMKADVKNANLNCANLKQSNLLGVKWQDAKIENIQIGKKLSQEVHAQKALKEKNIKQAIDYFEQAEEVYRDLRKHSEQEGIFTLSGNLIQKELTMRRMQMPQYSIKRITSKVVDLFCGYGEDPLRIVGISMLLILFCAILYTFTGLNYQGTFLAYNPGHPLSENINFFLSCLYYSVVTFTTLGYGDFTPIGISRAIAAIEAFTGSFTIALFVVVFVKKMTR